MASLVKVITSDIKSNTQKQLFINIVKHAFSSLLSKEEFKQDKNTEVSDIVKLKKFRKELVVFVHN